MERNENCFSIPVDKREAMIRWTFFFYREAWSMKIRWLMSNHVRKCWLARANMKIKMHGARRQAFFWALSQITMHTNKQTNKRFTFLPLKRKKNWSKTYLPALVIIISVSSRWNISQSSLFRRRTVMVLCSPSIFVLLAVWILPLEPWKSLLVFKFRSCASVFSCKVLTRVECISTLSAHVSMGSVEIGVFVLSRWSGDFELNSCAIFWLFFDAKNNQCRSFSTIPIKFSSSR